MKTVLYTPQFPFIVILIRLQFRLFFVFLFFLMAGDDLILILDFKTNVQ